MTTLTNRTGGMVAGTSTLRQVSDVFGALLVILVGPCVCAAQQAAAASPPTAATPAANGTPTVRHGDRRLGNASGITVSEAVMARDVCELQ